jgi:hypothetical protein
VLISYAVTNLGGSAYQYTYSVYNNGSLGAGVAIQLFDIAFASNLYSNLVIVTPNPLATQWSQDILGAVGSNPPYYDVESNNGGIAVGNTVSGFEVQFNYLGIGTPGSQAFQIYNPQNFALLQSGNTTPEPSSFAMFGALLLVAAFGIRRKRAPVSQ